MRRCAGWIVWSVLATCMLVGPWLFAGVCRAEEPREKDLVARINTALSKPPNINQALLAKDYTALFCGASRSALLRLADNESWHVAMQARWELRRFVAEGPIAPDDRYYPVAFLVSKKLNVPKEWEARLAKKYWAYATERSQASCSKHDGDSVGHTLAFIGPRPESYEKFYGCCIPIGTTVSDREDRVAVVQGNRSAQLRRPLIHEKYDFFQCFGSMGDFLFVPLVTEHRTFMVFSCAQQSPFIIAGFNTETGAYKWETLGWSGYPKTIRLGGSETPPLLGRQGATTEPRNSAREERDGGRYNDMYALYVTATDELVAVFTHNMFCESVEVFSATDGKCLLRFSTHSWDWFEEERKADEPKLEESKPGRS